MLPAGQRDVLQSIYEWCYTGRPSYRVLTSEGELPKNFDDAACAFDRAAAEAPLSKRTTLDAVPELMLEAEFFASGVHVAGALRALEDRGFLQVMSQVPQVWQVLIFCGAWRLPDGRRFTVYGKYEPAEPGSALGGTRRFSYTLDGHVVGQVRTAETTFPRTFRATERGIQVISPNLPGPDASGTEQRPKRTVPKVAEMRAKAQHLYDLIQAQVLNDEGKTLADLLRTTKVASKVFQTSKHFENARAEWQTLQTLRDDNKRRALDPAHEQDSSREKEMACPLCKNKHLFTCHECQHDDLLCEGCHREKKHGVLT
jgi:hypothetical protein